MELYRGQCETCRTGAPRATPEERSDWCAQLPHWSVVEVKGVEHLQRVFSFANFTQALDFTLRVGHMADEQDHHPALLTEWGKVTVNWWTHKIGGLHRNDFVCAARTDQLYL